MNKQELTKRIEGLRNLFGNESKYIEIDMVIRLISELEEPQKVQVPQFVADYIDFKKTYDFHVYGAMRVIEDHNDKRVQEWFYEGNIETFVRAWLDGYEVEKEKRYYVRFKGMEVGDFNYLNFIKFQRAWVLSSIKIDKKFRTEHTKKQLEEAGFGWVFDCPGIEIEEVEE